MTTSPDSQFWEARAHFWDKLLPWALFLPAAASSVIIVVLFFIAPTHPATYVLFIGAAVVGFGGVCLALCRADTARRRSSRALMESIREAHRSE